MIPPIGLWIAKGIWKLISMLIMIVCSIVLGIMTLIILIFAFIFNRMSWKGTVEYIFETKTKPDETPQALLRRYIKWLIYRW